MSYPLPALNAMGASDMAAWDGLDAEDGKPPGVQEAPLRPRCTNGGRGPRRVLIAPSYGNPASRVRFAATLGREVTFTQL